MKPRRLWRTLRRDWRRNHRHHGGAAAVLRCLGGTAAVHLGGRRQGTNSVLESLTFSVIPGLTAAWLQTSRRAWDGEVRRSLVGDCSGGFRWPESQDSDRRSGASRPVEAVPILNIHHGTKLDLFLRNLCSSSYVLLCDDDVFWRDSTPLTWALETMERDPRLVVASLMPRKQVSSVLAGRLEEPMGSDCLVIRRQLWLEQELSFEVVWPDPSEGFDWCYDTGDWAHLEILRRGFGVAVAPPEVRRNLLAFDGISSWLLRFQDSTPGSLAGSLEGFPERHPKALRTLFLVETLEEAGCDILVSPRALEGARKVLRKLVPEERAEALRRHDQPRLDALMELLAANSAFGASGVTDAPGA